MHEGQEAVWVRGGELQTNITYVLIGSICNCCHTVHNILILAFCEWCYNNRVPLVETPTHLNCLIPSNVEHSLVSALHCIHNPTTRRVRIPLARPSLFSGVEGVRSGLSPRAIFKAAVLTLTLYRTLSSPY
jgi:hypothetical protein